MKRLIRPRHTHSQFLREENSAASFGAARIHSLSSRLLDMLEERVLLTAATHLAFAAAVPDGFTNIALAPAITVDVEDVSNAIVPTDHSKVTISLLSGPGVVKGTLSAVAVHGVATFKNLLLSQTGSYMITVSDGLLATASSNFFAISAPPVATSLFFQQPPTSNLVGPNITPPIIVDIKDQYGHIMSNLNESVTLALATGPVGGKLTGTVKATAVHGVATFSNLNVTAGGDYHITATAAGGLNLTSSTFTMGGPRVATSLQFLNPPANVIAGAAMLPRLQVEVLDQFGNVLTTDHSAVKITVNTGPSLKGTFTAVAKNGIATFSRLVFTTAGAYTLKAADGLTTGATSSSFNVTNSVITHFAFTQVPVNGSPHGGTYTIVGEGFDRFNNVTTDVDAPVTVTYASAPRGTPPIALNVFAVNGVVTIPSVSFPNAGKYVLKATHGALHVLSKPFTLT